MTENPPGLSFTRDLRKALIHLYDPAELRKSPLVEALGLGRSQAPASTLQRSLIEAIEAVKPGGGTPPQSDAWRLYRILYHRYTEQCTQADVASILALSERQLRREEQGALRVLAEYLWAHYGVGLRAAGRPAGSAQAAGESQPPVAGTPSREEELEWLRRSSTGEVADCAQAVQAALRIARPLLTSLRARPEVAMPPGLPRVAVQPDTLRQTLLNILAPAIRAVPHGTVQVTVEPGEHAVDIRIEPLARHPHPSPASRDDLEGLEMARQLAELSGGSLEVAAAPGGEHPFLATLTLPIAEQAAVLVIDDNVDTLQLFQRCLAGTRYPFVGARDPDQALAMAKGLAPRIIVLDLMLPGLDGWEVLGRLREHPGTRGIPIVVCSILPQEQLALALGAAAFIRKPVTRAELLKVLDQVIGQRVSRIH